MFQRIAENRRTTELFHKRSGKLLESIAQDEHLRKRTQFVEKIFCTGHRVDFFNRFADFVQTEIVFVEDIDPVAHQRIVVRFVACRAPQFGNAGRFAERDPYFGDEHAFKVETSDKHMLSITYRSVL